MVGSGAARRATADRLAPAMRSIRIETGPAAYAWRSVGLRGLRPSHCGRKMAAERGDESATRSPSPKLRVRALMHASTCATAREATQGLAATNRTGPSSVAVGGTVHISL